MALVTFLTDFGLGDQYVAQMKGVVLKGCPGCQIVDISHMVHRHDIAEASFLLETTVPCFPRGTIHVAIVDPGVGSRRLPIIVKCRSATLVGPDNGVLEFGASRLGFVAAYKIRKTLLNSSTASSTFHGRDIFAEASALLACGRLPESMGTKLATIVRIERPKPRISKKQLTCAVLHVDTFGNVITNVANHFAKGRFRLGQRLRIESRIVARVARYATTYSDVRLGELTVLQGSQGYLELAAREDSASELVGLKVRDELIISPAS